ncbi:MAG: TetR/AcrR family transcriptional regulator C-terminal domain-containing protein, partial [Trebonia sp.]
VERLFAVLDGLGLDVMTAMWILMTLVTYVMGAALREIQEIRWQRAAAEAIAEMSAAAIAAAHDEFSRRVHETGQYPRLAQILDAGIDPDAPETRDERFEFGLSCVLDGIAARIKVSPA